MNMRMLFITPSSTPSSSKKPIFIMSMKKSVAREQNWPVTTSRSSFSELNGVQRTWLG